MPLLDWMSSGFRVWQSMFIAIISQQTTKQHERVPSQPGIIFFTTAALLSLHSKIPRPLSSGLLYQFGQLQQILVAKQTSPRSQRNERICRDRCGPTRWNRAQAPAAIMEVHSILTPVVAIGDQLEPLAFQRMVWMGDLKACIRMVAMRCS